MVTRRTAPARSRRKARRAARQSPPAATPAEGLRARKKQQVRDAILAACAQQFRARGFDETSVDDVVEAVGISRQTFFNYFHGKEAVLAELGLAWLRQQAEGPRAGAHAGRGASVFEGTRKFLRAQLRAIERDREFMRLVFTRSGLFFPAGPQVGTRSDARRLDRTREIFTAVAALMRTGQASGRVRGDLAAEQVAELYVAVMTITIRLWLTGYWGDSGSLVERGMRALDVLENGLRVRRRGA
jgi:AcrR family transcriptional regulator